MSGSVVIRSRRLLGLSRGAGRSVGWDGVSQEGEVIAGAVLSCALGVGMRNSDKGMSI